MSVWLAIDTASDLASVAIGTPDRVLAAAEVGGARRHASMLLPMLHTVLGEAGLVPARLAGVVLSDGPGSFTGLRVGAAAAFGLVRALGIPLHVAPSLMVRARGVAGDDARPIVAVADALRGEIYAGVYRFGPDSVETTVPAQTWSPEALMAAVEPPVTVVGDVPAALQDRFTAWSGRAVIGPPEGSPHARHLLRLIGVSGGAVPVRPGEWEPTYGRPAEAQARWEAAHGRALPHPTGRPR
ncbi:MAG: tRNA (adenosine(37)-N6)-threonylcarbamoyltransferase complex dimerization subunit type 1 TsaB [Gemmatimonadota bacterium]